MESLVGNMHAVSATVSAGRESFQNATSHNNLHQQCLTVSAAVCDRPGAVAITLISIVCGLLIFFVRRVVLRTKPYYLRKLMVEEFQRLREIQFQLEEAVLKKMGVQHVPRPEKRIRVFMDGAFDLMHFGHMNAFRLGRSLGTDLIVGVNSDASITENKGPPILNDMERQTAVEACRFVDTIVPECPYVMTPEYLDWVIKEYDIDYVVHGDDPCLTPDGKDVYASAKALGKYRSIPRTEGVSTTEIIGRMLVVSKEHHMTQENREGSTVSKEMSDNPKGHNAFEESMSEVAVGMGLGKGSQFLATSNLVRSFSKGMSSAPPGARIVYVDGTWDMFHAGHIKFLENARKEGDYLLVGIYSDAAVNAARGYNYPVMNMNERLLSVLACKHVDDVLVAPPWAVTQEMVDRLNISVVVSGSTSDGYHVEGEADPYEVAKKLGVFKQIEGGSDLCLETIADRVRGNRERYEAKFKSKKVKEDAYYTEKYKDTKKAG